MSVTASPVYIVPDVPVEECPSWFRDELINNAKSISTVIILGFINVIIISGNLLVVMAVFASAKLRTVTNFLIVSLAISDLLVGLAVLPYSITLEILDVWIFGELWCQMWLAVDVWLCTASILNLCAISVDRYLAITRPVHYRTIMSTMKVKLLIALVWILSFIICFPPLVGWNDRVKDESFNDNNGTLLSPSETSLKFIVGNFSDDVYNTSFIQDDTKFLIRNASLSRRCSKPQCALITNPGYVIYSALGSFYIPMLVMLFFYYRIYVVALRTSRALDRGFRTAKSTKHKGSSEQDAGSADVTLRIHRGRPTNESMSSSRSCNSVTSSRRSGDILVPRRIPTVVYHHTKDFNSPRCIRDNSMRHYHTTAKQDDEDPCCSQRDNNRVRRTKSATPATSNFSFDTEKPSTSKGDHLTVSGGGQRNGPFTKSSKRNARWHAKRFRTEAKATKTVGIIVGGFILCWLPFFTVYLIMGFCEACIPEILFKVFFYLGYCNSALNPIIYGIISKDFRFAFKRILCRCTMNDDSVASLIRHIHMPTFNEEESTPAELSSSTR